MKKEKYWRGLLHKIGHQGSCVKDATLSGGEECMFLVTMKCMKSFKCRPLDSKAITGELKTELKF